jgi:hypothetical protein
VAAAALLASDETVDETSSSVSSLPKPSVSSIRVLKPPAKPSSMIESTTRDPVHVSAAAAAAAAARSRRSKAAYSCARAAVGVNLV